LVRRVKAEITRGSKRTALHRERREQRAERVERVERAESQEKRKGIYIADQRSFPWNRIKRVLIGAVILPLKPGLDGRVVKAYD